METYAITCVTIMSCCPNYFYPGLVHCGLRFCSILTQVTASKKINYQDIVKLEQLSDDEEIVLVSLKSRIIRLVVSDSAGFVSAIQRNMKVPNFITGSKP